MARYFEPTQDQQDGFKAWIAERPASVQAIADKFPPWELFLLKTSNHRVFIRSFDEHTDGTVTLTVVVSGRFNLVMFERAVFGIKPEDLEPCDVPGPEEPIGAVLDHDGALRYVKSVKDL